MFLYKYLHIRIVYVDAMYSQHIAGFFRLVHNIPK